MVFTVAMTLAEALLRGVGLVVLLVLLRAVIPSDQAARVLSILLIATMALSDTYGPLWLRAIYALSAAILCVMLARRFGLLAVISFAFLVLIQQRVPFTTDAGDWYFGRSAVVMFLLVCVLVSAFRIAVGPKRWLPRFALE